MHQCSQYGEALADGGGLPRRGTAALPPGHLPELLRWRVQKRPYAQGQEGDCQTCNPGCISGARNEGGLDEQKREQLTPYVRGAGR